MDAVAKELRFPGAALALHGAGQAGRGVLARLRAGGVEPVAFTDDTPAKQGTSIDGIPVLRPEDALDRYGETLVLAVTILNRALPFLEARRQLAARGLRTWSVFHLAWAYRTELLPLLFLDTPMSVVRAREQLTALDECLADDESRENLRAHVAFRLRLEFEDLPAPAAHGYFPPEVLQSLPDGFQFVDCGAYDGDSLRELLAQSVTFARAIAVEPDTRNAERLERFVAGLPPQVADRIAVVSGAVGSAATTATFEATGDMGAALSPTGAERVPVFRIDDLIAGDDHPAYVKLDVEGAEHDALRGASGLIEGRAPHLAVSVYHRPADLWELPLSLLHTQPNYGLSLRTQGVDGTDLICYARSTS